MTKTPAVQGEGLSDQNDGNGDRGISVSPRADTVACASHPSTPDGAL